MREQECVWVSLEGDFEHGYVSVGNGISAIDRVKSVQELVDELMADIA